MLFVLASVACGPAPSLSALVAARVVQGIGSAVTMPTSMALVRHAYPGLARRARAVGVWALGGAVAAAAGPVLGGVLSLASWRMIFWINLPVGLVTLLLLARAPQSPPPRRRSTGSGRSPASWPWAG
ncbi:MFS transporter [Streptomyces sp. LZ34]